MKHKNWSLKIFSILLLVCTLLVVFPLNTFAATDYVGITVSDSHAIALDSMFTSVPKAQQYASTTHSITVIAGQSLNLGVTGVLHDDYNVSWSSSSNAVARIDSQGKLTGRNIGSAVITAVCVNTSGETVTANLAVNVVADVSLSHHAITASVNKLCDINVNLTGDLDKYIYDVQWGVSDGALLQVGNGLVIGQKAGIGSVFANVYSKNTGALIKRVACEVTILDRMSNVAVVNKIDTMEIGESHTFQTTTVPDTQKAVWVSSNTDVAVVDAYGRVTAVGVGKVIIYAYAGCWQNNQYVKDTDVYDEIEINVWTSSSIKYDAELLNDQNGNVTLSNTNAYPNEVITVYAKNILAQKGEGYEAKGATIISVVDERGHAVRVDKVAPGVFTFVMPKGNVKINPVYSSLYQVSVESGLVANTARNENVVARLLVSEYVSGSFGGDYVVGSSLNLSGVNCEYATVTSNANGTLSFHVNDMRTVAGKFTIEILANAQSIVEGKKGIVISGAADMNFDNTVYTYYKGDINARAEHVTLDVAEKKTVGKVLTISAADQIVIYGEALQYIQQNGIDLELKFIDGVIELPNTSLKLLSALKGGFTVFGFKIDADPYGDENSLGMANMSAKAYTSAGLVQEQLTMLGKGKLTITTDNPGKLTITSSQKKVESTGKNVFEMNSFAGLASFSITSKAGILDGDLTFILIVVVLLLLLGVAVVFLIRRLKAGQVEEHAKIDNDDPDPTPDPNPTPDPILPTDPSPKDDFREDDVVDLQSFKTVDDILKESNLEYKAAEIQGAALGELQAEINREVSEYANAKKALLSNEYLVEVKYNLVSLGVEGEDVLEEKHRAFESSMKTAERVKSDSVLMLDNNVSTELLHQQADNLRDVTSVMMQQKTEYEEFCRTLLADIKKACDALAAANEVKTEIEAIAAKAGAIILEKQGDLHTLSLTICDAKNASLDLNIIEGVEKESSMCQKQIEDLEHKIESMKIAFNNRENVSMYFDDVEKLLAIVSALNIMQYVDALEVLIKERKALEDAAKLAKQEETISKINSLTDNIKELINTTVDSLYEFRQQEVDGENDEGVLVEIDNRSGDLISQKFELSGDTDNLTQEELDAMLVHLNEVGSNVNKLKLNAVSWMDSVKNSRINQALIASRDNYNASLAKATGVVNHALAVLAEADREVKISEDDVTVHNIAMCNEKLVTVQAIMLAHVADSAESLDAQKVSLDMAVEELSEITDLVYNKVEELRMLRQAAEQSVVDNAVSESEENAVDIELAEVASSVEEEPVEQVIGDRLDIHIHVHTFESADKTSETESASDVCVAVNEEDIDSNVESEDVVSDVVAIDDNVVLSDEYVDEELTAEQAIKLASDTDLADEVVDDVVENVDVVFEEPVNDIDEDVTTLNETGETLTETIADIDDSIDADVDDFTVENSHNEEVQDVGEAVFEVDEKVYEIVEDIIDVDDVVENVESLMEEIPESEGLISEIEDDFEDSITEATPEHQEAEQTEKSVEVGETAIKETVSSEPDETVEEPLNTEPEESEIQVESEAEEPLAEIEEVEAEAAEAQEELSEATIEEVGETESEEVLEQADEDVVEETVEEIAEETAENNVLKEEFIIDLDAKPFDNVDEMPPLSEEEEKGLVFEIVESLDSDKYVPIDENKTGVEVIVFENDNDLTLTNNDVENAPLAETPMNDEVQDEPKEFVNDAEIMAEELDSVFTGDSDDVVVAEDVAEEYNDNVPNENGISHDDIPEVADFVAEKASISDEVTDNDATFKDVSEIIKAAEAKDNENLDSSTESLNDVVLNNELVVDEECETEQDVTEELNSVEHVEVKGLSRNELIDKIKGLAEREAKEHERANDYLNKSSRSLSDEDRLELLAGINLNHEKFRDIFNNIENAPDSQLPALIETLEQMIKDMILIRGIAHTNFEPKRLSRKRLNYWRTQAESENPYISFIANAKLNAHRMRIKMGVQAHKANQAKQKNKK